MFLAGLELLGPGGWVLHPPPPAGTPPAQTNPFIFFKEYSKESAYLKPTTWRYLFTVVPYLQTPVTSFNFPPDRTKPKPSLSGDFRIFKLSKGKVHAVLFEILFKCFVSNYVIVFFWNTVFRDCFLLPLCFYLKVEGNHLAFSPSAKWQFFSEVNFFLF